MNRPGAAAAAVTTALVVAVAAAPPASAAAAGRAKTDAVCAPSAPLYESPGGLQIGVVAGGRTVFVLKRTASGKWVRVRTTIGARGWVRARQLCDEGA